VCSVKFFSNDISLVISITLLSFNIVDMVYTCVYIAVVAVSLYTYQCEFHLALVLPFI